MCPLKMRPMLHVQVITLQLHVHVCVVLHNVHVHVQYSYMASVTYTFKFVQYYNYGSYLVKRVHLAQHCTFTHTCTA